ncbi:MAG: hypothetical protein OCD03_10125 [Hyphomicrobiales bacterium]
MNIKKLLITTALILNVSVSAAYAADNEKNGTPPPPPPPIDGKAHSSDTPPPPPPAGNRTPGQNNGTPPENNGGGFVRPVHLIGPELGVTGDQFAKCFEAVNPVEQTGMGNVVEPSAEREQANKAVLLPCLQAINPSITNDLLDSVSNKYRPN